MKVKVTKTMVKTLNRALKTREFTNIDRFEFDTLLPYQYQMCVSDDLFTALDCGDFDSNENVFKFIRIIYKDECYSVDRYLTTYALHMCFKKCDKTFESFINEIFDACEI